jgi:hypothetical protein
LIRNFIFLLLLIGTAALAYYLVKNRGAGTLNANEKDFSIADTASIGKIFIADMQGHTIELVRDGSQWKMNGKYTARKDATDVMLTTLRAMTVRYPVPDAARKTVINSLATKNRKVMVYDLDDKPIKTFYIGQPTTDNVGNYMLLEGADNPYAVEIPGFQGTLETRFITDTLELRSRSVLAIPFTALAKVSVVYTASPDSSFAIDVTQSDSFRVYNPVTGIALPRKNVNKDKLFEYMSFLKEVNAEAFETNNPIKVTILAQRPFCTLTVKRRDGKTQTIDCYHKPIDRRSKLPGDTNVSTAAYDTDRFYGLVDEREFVLLQYFHFGRLLRSLDYFRA